MTKKCFAAIFFLVCPLLVKAQADSASQLKKIEKFLQHCYFPFDVGIVNPVNQKNLGRSFYTSSGAEYRFDREKSFFIKISWDSHSSVYHLAANTTTNTVKSKLDFNSFLAGVGHRWQSEKHMWRFSGLIQGGLNRVQYPVINMISNNYEITTRGKGSLAVKASACVELYPIKGNNGFAITMTPFYLLLSSTNVFWPTPNHHAGLSVGISTVLF